MDGAVRSRARRGGGAKQSRAWQGRAGRGRTGRGEARRDDAPRGQSSISISRAPKTPVLDDPSEARTNKILCKTNRRTLRAFDTRLCVVYPRDDGRSSFRAADQWTDVFFVFVNLFHARHVQEYLAGTAGTLPAVHQRFIITNRQTNPDMPRAIPCGAVWVGA